MRMQHAPLAMFQPALGAEDSTRVRKSTCEIGTRSRCYVPAGCCACHRKRTRGLTRTYSQPSLERIQSVCLARSHGDVKCTTRHVVITVDTLAELIVRCNLCPCYQSQSTQTCLLRRGRKNSGEHLFLLVHLLCPLSLLSQPVIGQRLVQLLPVSCLLLFQCPYLRGFLRTRRGRGQVRRRSRERRALKRPNSVYVDRFSLGLLTGGFLLIRLNLAVPSPEDEAMVHPARLLKGLRRSHLCVIFRKTCLLFAWLELAQNLVDRVRVLVLMQADESVRRGESFGSGLLHSKE